MSLFSLLWAGDVLCDMSMFYAFVALKHPRCVLRMVNLFQQGFRFSVEFESAEMFLLSFSPSLS